MKIKLALVGIAISTVVLGQAWTEMTEIPENLTFPVAVELNGNIHLIGGGGPNGATDLHLRYTVSSDTWDTLAPVPYLAQQPAGAVVNGKIYFLGGGFPNSGTPLNDNYAYDPQSDSWSKLADIPVNRVIHEAAALFDSIYVMGGQPDKLRFERYSVNQDSWSSLSNLPDQHFWYGTIVNVNDTIYRFGGGAFGAPQFTAQRYDLVNDNWVDLPDMPTGLHAPAAGVIGDSIYVVGGYNQLGKVTDKVWIYDIHTQQYHEGFSLPKVRNYHEVVSVGNCIYAIGGHDLTVDKSISRHCLGDTAITGIAESAEGIGNIQVYFDNGEWKINLGSFFATKEMQLLIHGLNGKLLIKDDIRVNELGEAIIKTTRGFSIKSGQIYVVTLLSDSYEESYKLMFN